MIAITHNYIFNGTLVGYRLLVNGARYYDTTPDLVDLLHKGLNIARDGKDIVVTDTKGYFEAAGLEDVPYADFNKLIELSEIKCMQGTDMELYKKYKNYNEAYFGGSLEMTVGLIWSRRQSKSAGSLRSTRSNYERLGYRFYPDGYVHGAFLITMSEKYRERFPEDVDNVLLHEMIHAYAPYASHGPVFMQKLNMLNAKYGLSISRHSLGRPCYNYLYVCPGCGQKWERNRKIAPGSRCGGCRSIVRLVEED